MHNRMKLNEEIFDADQITLIFEQILMENQKKNKMHFCLIFCSEIRCKFEQYQMQNKMKLDAEIFDADLNENRCKFARQPYPTLV